MIIIVHEYANAVETADLRHPYFPFLLSCSQHPRGANRKVQRRRAKGLQEKAALGSTPSAGATG